MAPRCSRVPDEFAADSALEERRFKPYSRRHSTSTWICTESSAVVGHRLERRRAFSGIVSGDWSRLAADHGDAYRLHCLRGGKGQAAAYSGKIRLNGKGCPNYGCFWGQRLMFELRLPTPWRALGSADSNGVLCPKPDLARARSEGPARPGPISRRLSTTICSALMPDSRGTE
jgi:hypothetical protein